MSAVVAPDNGNCPSEPNDIVLVRNELLTVTVSPDTTPLMVSVVLAGAKASAPSKSTVPTDDRFGGLRPRLRKILFTMSGLDALLRLKVLRVPMRSCASGETPSSEKVGRTKVGCGEAKAVPIETDTKSALFTPKPLTVPVTVLPRLRGAVRPAATPQLRCASVGDGELVVVGRLLRDEGDRAGGRDVEGVGVPGPRGERRPWRAAPTVLHGEPDRDERVAAAEAVAHVAAGGDRCDRERDRQLHGAIPAPDAVIVSE